MKIMIFGASGSGGTTLGKALGKKLGWRHLDSDDYYWKKTKPPFQEKIPREQRNANIQRDFESEGSVIISGSMCSWHDDWKSAFDLAIFLFVPPEIRMERLRKREIERYGDLLKTDSLTIETSNEFLEWASNYDDRNFDGQSIARHEREIKSLSCPVLDIRGDTTVEERTELAVAKIDKIKSVQ